VSPAQHLQNAEEIMDAVRHAAEDFLKAPTPARAKTAIRNFLEQGRSVTWALQHLKRAVPDQEEWDRWWASTTAPLREDAAAQCFYKLRNPIVKEGHPVEIRSITFVKHMTIESPKGPAPPGAIGIEIDFDLNTWWSMPNGGKILAKPPPAEGVVRWNTLVGVPEDLQRQPLTQLMQRYVEHLEDILVAARERFGSVDN
jgi:hypothetical protein